MPAIDLPKITDRQIEEIANRFLTQGATFKELKGISDEELEAVYTVGHNLFTNAKYEEAENTFRLLCFLDHLSKKFWLGLGACRKARQDYLGAIDAFGLAGIMDLKDPRAALQSAECHILMGNPGAAVSAYNAVLKYSTDPAARGRAELMLKTINEKAAQK
jgi:type III secretion system low calcium response chaperone LcrH/SycD